MDSKGQVFTIEAIVAGILLLATLVFALQAAAISANTGSGGDMEIRSQHAGLVEGVLDEAVENETLKQTLLYWDAESEEFYDADDDDGYYISRSPPEETVFGESLASLFDERQVRYNIDLYYRDADGDRQKQRLVEFGTPSDDAVRVVETVTLYDDDRLFEERNGSLEPTDVTLDELSADEDRHFYAPDAGGDSVYNVIRVEVVLWQS